jgi:hypothetical protein
MPLRELYATLFSPARDGLWLSLQALWSCRAVSRVAPGDLAWGPLLAQLALSALMAFPAREFHARLTGRPSPCASHPSSLLAFAVSFVALRIPALAALPLDPALGLIHGFNAVRAVAFVAKHSLGFDSALALIFFLSLLDRLFESLARFLFERAIGLADAAALIASAAAAAFYWSATNQTALTRAIGHPDEQLLAAVLGALLGGVNAAIWTVTRADRKVADDMMEDDRVADDVRGGSEFDGSRERFVELIRGRAVVVCSAGWAREERNECARVRAWGMAAARRWRAGALVFVDAEENAELLELEQMAGVSRLPDVRLFEGGKEVQRVVGFDAEALNGLLAGGAHQEDGE